MVVMETIVRAACRDGDAVYSVAPPGRHHNVMHEQMFPRGIVCGPRDQGFLTSRGRFVSRREACKIAKRAKQIIRKTGPDDILFSEDLW